MGNALPWQERIWRSAPNRKWLGVYFESADAIGDTDILTTTKDGQTLYAAEVDVAMRIRNRLVLLRCKNLNHDFANWQDPQKACKQWAEDIGRANGADRRG